MSSAMPCDSAINVNAFQTHSLREAASGLGVMSPQTYMSVVATAQAQFLASMSLLAADRCGASVQTGITTELDDMPRLKAPLRGGADVRDEIVLSVAPGGGARTIAGAANLTELLGKLMDIIGGNRIEQLRQRADIWNRLSKAMQNELDNLSNELDRATADAAAAASAATKAQRNAADALIVGKAADQALLDAEAALKEAKKQDPTDDERVENLQTSLGFKSQAARDARTRACSLKAEADAKLKDAMGVAMSASDAECKANAAQERAIQQFGGQSPVRPVPTARLNGAAELTAVLGTLQMLVASSNVDELESKQKIFDEMQKAREANLREKSEAYQQEVRKAEEMQKIMGCVGKVVGWIVTAVSFAAAVVTGGASLALAAVGLALAVGDQICEAATGVSFLDKVMQPIMDHILKPVMNLISLMITNALVECGIERKAAELTGAVLGAVLSGIALVVAAFAGASLLQNVAKKVIQSMTKSLGGLMEKSFGRMLARLVEKSGLTALGARTTSAIGRMRKAIGAGSTEDALLMANRVEKWGAALGAANQVALAAGDVAVGIERSKAMHLLADVKEVMYDAKLLGNLLKQAVDTFAQHNKMLAKLMQNMSDACQVEAATGKLVLRNVRAI